jgi:hypothetical protein
MGRRLVLLTSGLLVVLIALAVADESIEAGELLYVPLREVQVPLLQASRRLLSTGGYINLLNDKNVR